MIGPRVGLKAGERAGVAVGPGADPIAADSGAAPSTTTLTVAISDSADPVISSVNFDYTVAVENTGSVEAENVVVTVTLDASLTYVSASGTGWTVDASGAPDIVCTRAALAVGTAPDITITVTAAAAGSTETTDVEVDADNAAAPDTDQETTVVNLVTKDATSGKRVPASSAEWTSLISYYSRSYSAPNSLWLCQEASGNLADSIGGNTLTANASPGYQQAVSGWDRDAVTFVVNTAGQRFTAVIAAFAPATHSMMWLGYIALTDNPSTTRSVLDVGAGATTLLVQHTATGLVRCNCAAVTTDSSGSYTGAGVIPLVMIYDRTNSTVKVYTDAEKITGTYSASVTGTNQGIGAASGNSTGQATLYLAAWADSAAELSDATLKLMLQDLGWTIAWS